MTSLQDLLPDPNSSPLCADFSRSINLDPGGTAIRADRVVLIETPLPWPKPVFDHPFLTGIQELFKTSAIVTRVLATTTQESTADAAAAVEGEEISVHVFDRNEVAATAQVDHYHFRVPVKGLLPLAQSLVVHPIGAPAVAELEIGLKHRAIVASPIVLVCTQGSHDICCGAQGMRFANEAQASTGALVFKVSHTGGHRFAPTAMTFPDGRMWADLTVEKLEQIFARPDEVHHLVGSYRGWWGAERGPAQVAERAVFAEEGWGLGASRSVQVLSKPSEDDPKKEQLWRVETTSATNGTDHRVWEVAVSARRQVPTISCHSPGGLPAKPSTEYQVDHIRQVTDSTSQ